MFAWSFLRGARACPLCASSGMASCFDGEARHARGGCLRHDDNVPG